MASSVWRILWHVTHLGVLYDWYTNEYCSVEEDRWGGGGLFDFLGNYLWGCLEFNTGSNSNMILSCMACMCVYARMCILTGEEGEISEFVDMSESGWDGVCHVSSVYRRLFYGIFIHRIVLYGTNFCPISRFMRYPVA